MTRYFRWSISTFLTVIIFLLIWLISGEPLTTSMFYFCVFGVFVGWMITLADSIFGEKKNG